MVAISPPQSPKTTPPRPPSGFLRLLDELYPDDEKPVSNAPRGDGWPNELYDWWQNELFENTDSAYIEGLQNFLNTPNLNQQDHQQWSPTNQTPWPGSSASAPPVPPSPTQTPSHGQFPAQASSSSDAPEGQSDLGPVLKLSSLRGEISSESMDQVLDASRLNERPDENGSLSENQNRVDPTPA